MKKIMKVLSYASMKDEETLSKHRYARVRF